MPQANKQYGHPDFYKLLDQMAELHSRKNHDYAGTSDPLKNLRACTRLELDPFMGVMVRLQDKWSRIEEFVKSKTLLVKNESVEDTLMDNAVYSLLAIILLREQKKNTGVNAVTNKASDWAGAYGITSDDYNVLEIDGPRFKAGDKVKIVLRDDTGDYTKQPVEKNNGIGAYIERSAGGHKILLGDNERWFYPDEIFPMEGN